MSFIKVNAALPIKDTSASKARHNIHAYKKLRSTGIWTHQHQEAECLTCNERVVISTSQIKLIWKDISKYCL